MVIHEPQRVQVAARLRCVHGLLGAALLLAAPRVAGAGSFFVEEQSVSASGRAFAGESALADDASAIFYNPASVVGFVKPRLTIGNYLTSIHADFDDTGAQAFTPGTLGNAATVSGDDGGNPFGVAPLANFSIGVPLGSENAQRTQRWWIGLNVLTPFALDSKFGESWFGRYDSTRARITGVDVSPTLGWAVTPRFTLGVTVSARYDQVTFENALPNPLTPGGPSTPTDGEFKVKGDDWDAGYAVGARWEPVDGTKIGVAYRSKNSLSLDGHAQVSEFTGLAGALLNSGKQSSTVKFSLPDVVFVGVAQDVTRRLTLLAQYNWYHWSVFDDVRVELPGGQRLVSDQGYHDSRTIAAGAEYRWNDRWTLRAGAQFDQTPIDDQRRSTQTPDNDRYRVSCGLTYALREGLLFDLAYSHVFVQDAKIDRSDPFFVGTPLASTVRTRADTSTGADILGVAVRVLF